MDRGAMGLDCPFRKIAALVACRLEAEGCEEEAGMREGTGHCRTKAVSCPAWANHKSTSSVSLSPKWTECIYLFHESFVKYKRDEYNTAPGGLSKCFLSLMYFSCGLLLLSLIITSGGMISLFRFLFNR